MRIKINCKMNDRGVWCKDKRTPRSFFGLGARICCETKGIECFYKQTSKRPDVKVHGQGRKDV